jgi:hypothetical protein
MRHFQRIEPRALVDVDEVQAARVVPDADFARAGRAHVALDDAKLLRSAGFLDDRCSGHVHSLSCPAGP